MDLPEENSMLGVNFRGYKRNISFQKAFHLFCFLEWLTKRSLRTSFRTAKNKAVSLADSILKAKAFLSRVPTE